MTLSRAEVRTIASLYQSRWLQGYAKGKLGSDPVYAATLEALAGFDRPILDLGCGIGLLAHYLRARDVATAIRGIDFDPRKIEAGRASLSGDPATQLEVGDVRTRLDFAGSVTLLDVLHYFSDADQQLILELAAAYASNGGVVVIRDCVNDGSWRYRATYLEESFALGISWLRGGKLNFPTLETLTRPFRERGFASRVQPMWGKTPFNNHLLVFTRG